MDVYRVNTAANSCSLSADEKGLGWKRKKSKPKKKTFYCFVPRKSVSRVFLSHWKIFFFKFSLPFCVINSRRKFHRKKFCVACEWHGESRKVNARSGIGVEARAFESSAEPRKAIREKKRKSESNCEKQEAFRMKKCHKNSRRKTKRKIPQLIHNIFPAFPKTFSFPEKNFWRDCAHFQFPFHSGLVHIERKISHHFFSIREKRDHSQSFSYPFTSNLLSFNSVSRLAWNRTTLSSTRKRSIFFPFRFGFIPFRWKVEGIRKRRQKSFHYLGSCF